MSKQNIVRHSTHYLLFMLLLLGLPGKLQAQSAEDASQTEAQSQPDSTSTSQSVSILSIEGGKKLMMEADQAIEAQQ